MATRNRIDSQVQALRDIEFLPIPTGRPVLCDRGIRHDGAVVIIDTAGRIYTSQVTAGLYWRTERQMRKTVDALIKMGKLSPEAVAEHRALQETEHKSNIERWAASSVLENAEILGLKFNKTQQKRLDAAKEKK